MIVKPYNVYMKLVTVYLSSEIDAAEQVETNEKFTYISEFDEKVTDEIRESARKQTEEHMERYWANQGKTVRVIAVIRSLSEMSNEELASIVERASSDLSWVSELGKKGYLAADNMHEVVGFSKTVVAQKNGRYLVMSAPTFVPNTNNPVNDNLLTYLMFGMNYRALKGFAEDNEKDAAVKEIDVLLQELASPMKRIRRLVNDYLETNTPQKETE